MLDQQLTPPPVSETITWVACSALMPDADLTVLIFTPEIEDDPTGEGFFDGEQWRDAESGWPFDSDVVTWWAKKPVGPVESTALARKHYEAITRGEAHRQRVLQLWLRARCAHPAQVSDSLSMNEEFLQALCAFLDLAAAEVPA